MIPNPINGLLSIISCCRQCRVLLFDEHEPDINNNMHVFFRQKRTTRLYCENCLDRRFGNHVVFRIPTCAVCIYEARFPNCVCRLEDFQPYQIRIGSVLVRNEEVLRLEENIWNELVFNCLFDPVTPMVR